MSGVNPGVTNHKWQQNVLLKLLLVAATSRKGFIFENILYAEAQIYAEG